MTDKKRLVLGGVIPLFWFSMYTYTAFLTEHIVSLGASLAYAGTVTGMYGLVQMLLRIPAGLLSDRLGRRRPFVIAGCFFSGLSALLLCFAKTPELILIARCLAGAAASCWVQISVLFSSYYPPEKTPGAVATALSLNTAGQLAGVLAGTLVTISLPVSSTFVLAAAGAGAGLLLSFFTKETPIEKTPGQNPFRALFLDREALVRLISVSVLAILAQIMLFGGPYGFAPKLALDLFGASRLGMGFLTVASSLAVVVSSRFFSPPLQKKAGFRKTALLGFLLCSVYFLSVPLIKHLWALFALQALYGLGQGLLFPVLMGLAIHGVPESRRGAFMGVFQSVYGLGMFAGPALVGVLGDAFGLVTGFFAAGLFGAGAVVLCLFLPFESRKKAGK